MKKFIALLISFIFVSLFVLSACSSVEEGDYDPETHYPEDALELLSFETITQNDIPSRRLNSKELEQDEGKIVLNEDEKLILRATVKNLQRDPFMDLVIYATDIKTEAVFNEGHGEYQCSSTTVYSEGIWITNIYLEYDPADYDGYLQIEDIVFLHAFKNDVKAQIPESAKTRIDYHKHHLSDYIILKEATDFEDGERYKECPACHMEIHEIIPARFSAIANLFDYELLPDGHAYSIFMKPEAKQSSKVEEVFIPNTYNGLPVTTIKENAFSHNHWMKEFTFGKNITTVGANAFVDCLYLKNVTINDGVQILGDSAFRYCTNLKTINIPNSITRIGNNAFDGCQSLESLTINGDLEYLGDSAFAGCYKIKSIILPDAIDYVGKSIFNSCFDLETFNVPYGTTTIDAYFFSCCYDIDAIELPNSVTKIETNAFLYVSLTSITLPNSITTIEHEAFSYCTTLTSITLPNSLSTLEAGVFSYCESLASLTIPLSVETIENGIISYSGVKDIYYPGTVSQWNAITKDANWCSNSSLETIHCSNDNISVA